MNEFQRTIQKPIHLKVMKSLRDWMEFYWFEDFESNEELKRELDL